MSVLKVIDSVLKKLLGKLHYVLNDPRIIIIIIIICSFFSICLCFNLKPNFFVVHNQTLFCLCA